MRKLTTIMPDGCIIEETHRTVSLALLQERVEGDIESVPHFHKYQGQRCRAWINENGVGLNMPLNEKATQLWLDLLGDGPFWYKPQLFGPLVIEQALKESPTP